MHYTYLLLYYYIMCLWDNIKKKKKITPHPKNLHYLHSSYISIAAFIYLFSFHIVDTYYIIFIILLLLHCTNPSRPSEHPFIIINSLIIQEIYCQVFHFVTIIIQSLVHYNYSTIPIIIIYNKHYY